MPTYNTSDTMVSKTAVARLVADGLAREWRNPRTGAVRHYIDADGLGAVIGFEQTYYSTGNISGVSYIDGDGDRATAVGDPDRLAEAGWEAGFWTGYACPDCAGTH